MILTHYYTLKMAEADAIAHALAGAGGGALSMIITYPMVTLSTVAQTGTHKDTEDSKTCSGEPTQLHYKIIKSLRNNSSYRAAQKIIKEKGVLGLYSGLESALYGITWANFVYYYFYEFATKFLLGRKSPAKRARGLTTLESMLAGAVAGALTCVGSNPLWVANTRTMTAKKADPGQSKSAIRMMIHIAETEGIGALFNGVFPALVLVVNPIIQYTIFEQIKNSIIANKGRKAFTPGKAFFIGAFGKLIATALTYPYITLKSRMHLQAKKVKEEGGVPELTMYQEIRKILREEGVDGLYGGLSVKLIQSITTAAFLFYFKEELLSSSVRAVQMLRLMKAKKAMR